MIGTTAGSMLVCCSRVVLRTSLEGLTLRGFNDRSIRSDFPKTTNDQNYFTTTITDKKLQDSFPRHCGHLNSHGRLCVIDSFASRETTRKVWQERGLWKKSHEIIRWYFTVKNVRSVSVMTVYLNRILEAFQEFQEKFFPEILPSRFELSRGLCKDSLIESSLGVKRLLDLTE